jgi:hypothetical protein
MIAIQEINAMKPERENSTPTRQGSEPLVSSIWNCPDLAIWNFHRPG